MKTSSCIEFQIGNSEKFFLRRLKIEYNTILLLSHKKHIKLENDSKKINILTLIWSQSSVTLILAKHS